MIKLKTTFTLVIALGMTTLSTNGFTQTGPGGVGNSANNLIWLDAHTMGGTDGAGISSWTDYSGNGIHAVQATAAKQPTFVADGLNSRDVINFNGTQNLVSPSNAGFNGAGFLNYFIVAEIDDPAKLSIPLNVDYGTPNYLDAFTGIIVISGNISTYGRSASNALKRRNFPASTGYHVYEGVYNDAANIVQAALDFGTHNSTTGVTKAAQSTHEGVWIGGKNTKYQIDGKIAEAFIFNSVLNTAQQTILENYIGSKYGFAVTTDRYAHDADHGVGVIGIGRDNSTNQNTDAIGNGVVRINTASSLSDGDYLLTGHSDVDLLTFSTNVPPSLLDASRFERIWRVDETGDVGTVTLVFDLDASSDFSLDPANYRLLIDTDEDFSVVSQTLSGTYSAAENSITFTAVNFADNNFFTLAGDTPQDIHSVATGDWDDPATWDCGCVPAQFNNVFIEPFNTVTMNVDGAAKILTVEVNGALEINDPVTLEIHEGIDMIGSVTATDGEIAFVGAVEQFFDPGGGTVTLNDVTVSTSDPAGMTFYEGTFLVNGTFSPNGGLIVIEATTDFVINSTGASTGGRVGIIDPSCTITGDVKVRRFIPSGVAEWRDICSPVIGADISMWDDSIAISGTGMPDGCSFGPEGCFHSAVYYVNDIQNKITNPTEPLLNTRGFEVYLGDDLTTFSGVTLQVSGTLNINADLVVSCPGNWSTVGNPYASSIDFTALGRSGTGNYYYVFDPATSAYQFYDGASGTGSIAELNSGIIPMGQGFWMKGPGTVTFNQAAKTTASATFVKAAGDVSTELVLGLSSDSKPYYCSVTFEENSLASDDLDELVDIPHLTGPNVKSSSIGVYVNEEVLRKNYIEKNFKNKSFELFTEFKYADTYTIEASNIENFNNYRHVYLIDKLTGEMIDLKSNLSYSFYSEETEENRFRLVLSNNESSLSGFENTGDLTEENDVTITQMASLIQIESTEYFGNSTVVLYNTMGQEVGFNDFVDVINGTTTFAIPSNFKGIYIIVVNNGQKVLSKKVVL